MGLHAFVAMPGGRRQDVDFAAIRASLVEPALAQAGFSILTTGEESPEQGGGRLRSDAIEQRLLADLVVIDLTSSDAPALYGRGVHNALLAHAVLLIQAEHSQPGGCVEPPTDGALTFTYQLKDGHPDPAHLAADCQALVRLITQVGREPLDRYRGSALSIPTMEVRGAAKPSPRQMLLFSGHMIDAPGRADPRFPAAAEGLAGEAIAAILDEIGIGCHDLAICGGACGGDLLFAEAALQRSCPVQLHLQFREAEFLRASVAFAGQHWVDRYCAVRDHPLTRVRVQPDELGPPARGLNPYVRNNLWQLYTALACAADSVRFIALWDGQDSANPGGTRNMVETISQHGGEVSILDTRRLFRNSTSAMTTA